MSTRLGKILTAGCGVLLCMLAQPCPAAVTINWTDVHQRIDGFGASSAHQSSITEAQADLFFSAANGVGLSWQNMINAIETRGIS